MVGEEGDVTSLAGTDLSGIFLAFLWLSVKMLSILLQQNAEG